VVRQPQQPASGSDEAALDLRQPELRAAGGGDEVARQDDLEAAGERVALGAWVRKGQQGNGGFAVAVV